MNTSLTNPLLKPSKATKASTAQILKLSKLISKPSKPSKPSDVVPKFSSTAVGIFDDLRSKAITKANVDDTSKKTAFNAVMIEFMADKTESPMQTLVAELNSMHADWVTRNDVEQTKGVERRTQREKSKKDATSLWLKALGTYEAALNETEEEKQAKLERAEKTKQANMKKAEDAKKANELFTLMVEQRAEERAMEIVAKKKRSSSLVAKEPNLFGEESEEEMESGEGMEEEEEEEGEKEEEEEED